MFRSVKSLGKKPSSQALYRALLELYRFAYMLLVVPVFVLSLIFVRDPTLSDSIAFVYLSLCAILCCVVYYLAEKPSSLETDLQTAFQRAMRLALVPALPAMFGLVSLAHPWVGKVLIGSSMVFYLLLLSRLRVHSRIQREESEVLEGEIVDEGAGERGR
jgi:hypothetical protein